MSCAVPSDPVVTPTAPQGWNIEDRRAFYTLDQGSRIMPTTWMMALKRPDGQPFLGDRLARYGYLANDADPASNLPIGFTTNGSGATQAIGMTCAACHTREIVVGEQRHRIDGGPALVDFESFLLDLRSAVKSVVQEPAAFDGFSEQVLGGTPAPGAKDALRKELARWDRRFDILITKSVIEPREKARAPIWGPGRLDAISMIFNRLTGLDIGPPANDHIMERNIYPADAPVRYPFLWGAPKQDATQWPGFAPNGSTLLGLGRNLGQVYGVFAEFHPRPDPRAVMNVDYKSSNSADMKNLRRLEELIRGLDRPRYPGEIKSELRDRGREIFGTGIDNPGQCWSCHGQRPGKSQVDRHGVWQTWATPIVDAHTDNRQHSLLTRLVSTGAMSGSGLPPLQRRLKPTGESPLEVLRAAVTGGILQKEYGLDSGNPEAGLAEPVALVAERPAAEARLMNTEDVKGLTDSYATVPVPPKAGFAYESRVLVGIWAAAPYLHNGSVPTLDDLLKPAAERPKSFRVGAKYDLDKVGLAAEQDPSGPVLHLTTCEDRTTRPRWDSGNGNCGHEYPRTGSLSPADRRALLEYLKAL